MSSPPKTDSAFICILIVIVMFLIGVCSRKSTPPVPAPTPAPVVVPVDPPSGPDTPPIVPVIVPPLPDNIPVIPTR